MSNEQKQADVETVLKVPFVTGRVSKAENDRIFGRKGYTPGRKEKAMRRARQMVDAVFEMYHCLEDISGSYPTRIKNGRVNVGASVFWSNFYKNLDESVGDAGQMLEAWDVILSTACDMYNEAKDQDSPAWKVEQVPVAAIEETVW